MQKIPTGSRKDKNLKKVVDLCYEMLELADHGDKFRRDDGCGVVFGTLRDAAYKVRRLAEKEISHHNRNRKASPAGKNKDTGDTMKSF